MPVETRDIFLSFPWRDLDAARRVAEAFKQAGVTVWFAEDAIRPHASITHAMESGVANSKALVAYYSSAYPLSRPCQFELTAAFVAAQRAGDPGRRVLVLNPEDGPRHIEPIELRDARYQQPSEADLQKIAAEVKEHVDSLPGALGDLERIEGSGWVGTAPLGSTHFVGRFDSLWKIHSALHGADYAGGTGAGVAQIRGLAGIGKTLLAEEYALRFGLAFPGGIFWLRGLATGATREDAPTAADQARHRQEQVRALAERLMPGRVTSELTPDEVTGLIRSAIEDKKRPCLWVVDDLPAGLTTDEVRAWLAPHPLARTLLTTRSTVYGALARVVEPGLLTTDEGYELLTAGRRPENEAEEAAAQEIVEDLGRHALALDVAGSALSGSAMWPSFADFRAALSEPSSHALELAAELADQLPTGHEPSIAATLLQSIDSLGEEGKDVLRVAATLGAAPIPLRLAESIFASLDGLDEAAARERLARALKQAASQSLTDPVANEAHARTVHGLVSRAVLSRTADSDRLEQIRSVAIQALLAELPKVTDIRTHADLAHWVAHARSLSVTPATRAEAHLLLWVALHDFERGDLTAARAQQVAVLEARERLLGAEHPETLIARNNLAETLLAQGDLTAARAHHEAVLGALERVLGADHPNTLASRNNLAKTLHAQGDLKAARAHQEAALEARKRILGAEHPATLIARNNLAETLHAQGHLTAARAHQEAVLEVSERVLGADHPNTLGSRNNLAKTLHAQGDLTAARAHHEAVFEVVERLLGADHPNTLIARGNLAAALHAQGDLTAARSHQEAVFETSERVLGADHPYTLTSRNNLAGTLFSQGDLKAARAHHETVLKARQRVLGADHPDTQTSRTNLATTLFVQGDLAAARAHQEAFLKANERVLGAEHPDTLTARDNLALVIDLLQRQPPT